MSAEENPSDESEIFIAVMGDLVGSRKLDNRAEVQEKLASTLTELNERFDEVVAARFLITLGDEFQGLLRAHASISEIWWFYQARMHEHVQTRFAFGAGTLSTPLRAQSVGIDGPCFHGAREALERSHKEKTHLSFGIYEAPRATRILNRISNLLDHTVRDWTPIQWQTILMFRESGSQAEVAKLREVTPQSIRDSLSSSRGLECLDTWGAIEEIFWAETGESA